MDFTSNPQQLHNSTTVWTQPQSDEQRRYYSKHAAEKRVFGIIATVFQGAHGFIAFAAWTAIFTWVLKVVPLLLPLAPFLAGFTLIALHVLFRTTWQTYWYDRLDDDPNTDSPVWVPAVILALLLFAEVQGAKQYLSNQVKPPEQQGTEQIDAYHATTIASIEQGHRNEVANIEAVYKAKIAPLDRQIYAARRSASSTDDDAARRSARSRVASLQSQRDQVLAEKAAALEKALTQATALKTSEYNRKGKAVSAVDEHNAREQSRFQADLGNVDSYAWILSVSLLLLIAGLSYRGVRINVKSGIIPLRNYTVLDAHGSIPERIWTAIADAFNRRSLQFAVFLHRMLSPRKAITSFDGTVVARPGTYNTPGGFFPEGHRPAEPVILKTQDEAAREVLAKMAANPDIRLTPDEVRAEIATAMTTNGHYKDLPLQGGKKHEAPAAPQAQAAGATRPEPAPLPSYDEDLQQWKGRVNAQLGKYDEFHRTGQKAMAAAVQDYLFTDLHSPIVKQGKRLRLEWGIKDGEFKVRHLDRQHFVPLAEISQAALLAPSPAPYAAPDDDDLFKQNIDLFKQKIQPHTDEAGKVIGIKYLKKDQTWTTYDYNTVRGQWGIYLSRSKRGEVSEAVQAGLEKWQYAMSLFEEGRRELRDNLQPITA